MFDEFDSLSPRASAKRFSVSSQAPLAAFLASRYVLHARGFTADVGSGFHPQRDDKWYSSDTER
jgi:hypothetical protein